jgi:basic amino acid/polyamine antiporter, APA family
VLDLTALGLAAIIGTGILFAPGGVDGVVTAASVIFFAYIGFDAVSTSGEETRKPARDLPIAIVGSLAIATLLYIAVAVVAVGALPFDQLSGQEAPLATALDEGAGFGWAADIISFGALVAISSVVLTILYGQTRIMFAMCRDGLMPRRFALPGPRHLDPVRGLARDRLRDLLLYGRRHSRLRRAVR